MACYRCETVAQRDGEVVGVCNRCGAFACRLDGERDAAIFDFRCGMCVPARLTRDAGLPPGPGDGDEGGTLPDDSPPPGGGGGGTDAGYASSADFEQRLPVLAEQSAGNRMLFRENLERILHDVAAFGTGERAEALRAVEIPGLDPERRADLANLLTVQIARARETDRLDEDLLADALGLAAWAAGIAFGQDPSYDELRRIGDARLRLAIGLSPVYV